MKKFYLLGLALLSLFACGAFASSAALANETLVEGAKFTGELTEETEGTLELIRYASSPPSTLILTVVVCSGKFWQQVTGGASLILITDVLSLANVETEELGDVKVKPLSCQVTHDDEEITDCKVGAAEVLPVNLSLELSLTWNVTVIELGGGFWLAVFPIQAGWDVECESLLGIKGSESCETGTGKTEALESDSTSTSPASVFGEFPAKPATEAGELERGKCGTTEHVAEVVGSGNTWILEGETRLATALS